MDRKTAKAEQDAIQAELRAVQARADALAKRPAVSGRAAEAIYAQETQELERRLEALGERIDALGPYNPQQEPGLWGWIARRHWVWGLIAGFLSGVSPALAVASVSGIALGYFEATAQIIPVLVVAVAVEGSVLRGVSPRIPFLNAYYPAYFTWVFIGEVASLIAIAQGHGSGLLFGMTVAALVSGTLILVLQAGLAD